MTYNIATRRRYVDWALRVTQDTPLAASRYERHLLECYVAGVVSLERVMYLSELHRSDSPPATLGAGF